MALAVERKKELVEAYKTHDSDTGSPEVQVATYPNSHPGVDRTFSDP